MESVGIYRAEKYTAYIYPKSLVITTNHQAFRISPGRHSTVYLDMLVRDILKGRITRIDDFKTYRGQLTWVHCSQPSLPY